MTDWWRTADALVAIFAGYVGATIALLVLNTTDPTPFETFAIVLPAQEGVTFGTFLWLARRRGATTPLRDLGVPPPAGAVWLVGFGVILAIAATVALTAFTDIDEAPQEIARLAAEASGATAWMAVIGTVVIAPVVEEVVFRGGLLRGIERRLGFAAAALISALAFAAFHYGGSETVVVLPPLFILGVVLAIVARRRGVGGAIFVHSGFNLLAALTFII